MLEQWFSSVLPATVTGDAFPLLPYLLCTLCSLALGAVIAAAHAFLLGLRTGLRLGLMASNGERLC